MSYGFHDWEETREWGKIDPVHLSYDEELYQRQAGKMRRKRKRKPRRILGVLVVSLILLALMVLGYAFAGGHFTPSQITDGLVPPAAASEKVMPVLLMGIDQRHPEEPSRADTIIVAFLDQKAEQVRLLSIPRDTLAYIPGRAYKDKINSSHAFGGPEATAEAVSDLLGIDVRYYVETNFEGFQEIVDTLGGVTINVDQRMYYPAEGIDLYPGEQRLQGHDALAFVRYRHYPLGDIDRIKHQQLFFSALAKEAVQWHNVWRVPELIRELNKMVKTNLSTTQMIRLAQVFKNINDSQVESYTLPGDPEMINGGSYWVPRTEEIHPLAAALIEGVPPQHEQNGKNSQGGEGEATPVTTNSN